MTSSYQCYMDSPFLSIKHSTYFSVYDRLFSPYIGKSIVFVEIGVLNGGSLFMWRAFFGEAARIIGIDLNPEAKRWENDGFEIFIGSQSDPSFWDRFTQEVGNVDIMLDDGGHTYEQQIVTAEAMLPAINDGGMLVTEDTRSSYETYFGGPSQYSFVEYAKNVVDGINHRYSTLKKANNYDDRTWSVQFFEDFVVFHVDRSLSRVDAVRTLNGGASVNAEDFRERDVRPATKARQLVRRFRWLTKIPLLGAVLWTLNRWVSLRSRDARLRKYFRY